MSQTSAQYIFIGEDHTDSLPLSFLRTNLAVLKAQGFTHFFAEHFDSIDQERIDQLVQVRSETNSNLLYQLLYDFGYDSRKYELITDTVLNNEYSLIAFDRRKDIKELFPGNKKLALRDQHMLLVAAQFIHNNPNKKIVFFNGSSHSGPNSNPEGDSFYELMLNYLDKSTTLNIKIDHYDGKYISPERLKLSKYSKQKFNLNCPSKTFLFKAPGSKGFDYYGFRDNQKAFPVTSRTGNSGTI